MSYSGGTFSINTTGQPVVSGTTISASVFNALTADLATGLSTCMLKDGTQTATAGIGFYAGTVSLPGIYFGTDTATGFYRIGLNNNGYTVNGTKLWDWSAAAATLTGALTVSAGITLSGTASNIALGSNYISNGGTDAGFSLDASNNATLSGALAITGALSGVTTLVASGNVTLSGGSATITAGTSATYGAFSGFGGRTYLITYGQTHGTYPDQIEFGAAGSAVGRWSSTGLSVTGTLAASDSITGTRANSTFVANPTTAAAILGHFEIKRSGTPYGYVGLNASDKPSLIDSAGVERLQWNTSGASVTGTLGVSDTVTLTGPAATLRESLVATGTTTAGNYWTLSNTGANLRIGIENSAGNAIISGGIAYSSVVGSNNNTVLQLIANGVAEVNISPTAGASRIINGIRIGADSTNNLLDDASNGAGTATLYIGNASINVTSDIRIKKNIKPTSRDALQLGRQLVVVDHEWNDPTDTSPRNRNSRGSWMGIIAQQAIDYVPWLINAPDPECQKCKDGVECDVHVSTWTEMDKDGQEVIHKTPMRWGFDMQYSMPFLLRMIQQIDEKVTALENK